MYTLSRKKLVGVLMKMLLISGSIMLPLLMVYSQKLSTKFNLIYNILAIITILVFGNIASLSIYKIIQENSVFMTAIHAVFLNPYFLITGSYIGIYVLYRILLLSMEEK